MIVIGQLPDGTSTLPTVISISALQLSDIVIPPARASSSATVAAATGASPASQPSTVVSVRLPVITGEVVSLIITSC